MTDTDFASSLPLGVASPWLAPLAGYSDLSFRILCREFGAACCVTEMVSAKGLCYSSNNTWRLLRTTPADQPLVIQLFGSEAEFLVRSIHMLREQGYEWFNLNMGCAVPKVAKQGAGAAMLNNVDNAIACAQAMVNAALPGHVSFKLRLGVTEQKQNWLEVALRLEEVGAGLVILHPRTAKQGYGGTARWEELSKAKEKLSVPVMASGDLFTAQDAVRCMQQTGVDGVMYARGALTNPAVFADHQALVQTGQIPERSIDELKAMIVRHMQLIMEHDDEASALYRLRSIVPRYVHSFYGVRQLRQRLCQCQSMQELGGILDDFMETALAAQAAQEQENLVEQTNA